MKRLLILGSGTGGSIMANKMRKSLKSSEWDITVIDRSDKHYYQPGQIFMPFKLYGYDSTKGSVRNSKDFIPQGVNHVIDEITRLEPDKNKVITQNGSYEYDWLILSLGCRIAPEEIDGMEEGYGKNVFYFYTPKSAMDMQTALANFDGGKLVLNIAEFPIKCPVAPIEYICLADYYFKLRGIRDKVQLEVVTSMDSIFTKPVAAQIMGSMLRERGINIVPNFSLAEVDSDKGEIKSYDGNKVSFDFLAAIPPNVGPAIIDEAGMGNGMGYALTQPNTLKSEKYPNIYVLGDNTNVTT
ncbi:MAG: NAD(P)/FAD-dependent oxidoreductase, partial [Spirochaetota bacterium]|nr:NAD(P)/FAD-dependent oxidoreductase [Spirochaetota bacterium]